MDEAGPRGWVFARQMVHVATAREPSRAVLAADPQVFSGGRLTSGCQASLHQLSKKDPKMLTLLGLPVLGRLHRLLAVALATTLLVAWLMPRLGCQGGGRGATPHFCFVVALHALFSRLTSGPSRQTKKPSAGCLLRWGAMHTWSVNSVGKPWFPSKGCHLQA